MATAATPGSPSPPPDPFATKEVYSDNWLSRLLIRLFTEKMSAVTGQNSTEPGFDGREGGMHGFNT